MEQPKGMARVCVTDYHMPALKRDVLIKSFKHTSARLGGTASMRSRQNPDEAASLTYLPLFSLTKTFSASIINFPLQSARALKRSTQPPEPSPHLMHFTLHTSTCTLQPAHFNLPTTGTNTGTKVFQQGAHCLPPIHAAASPTGA